MKKGILSTATILLSFPMLSHAQNVAYEIIPPPSYEEKKAREAQKEKLIREEIKRAQIAKEKAEQENIAKQKELIVKQRNEEKVFKKVSPEDKGEQVTAKSVNQDIKKEDNKYVEKQNIEKKVIKEKNTPPVQKNISVAKKVSFFQGKKGDMLSETLKNWGEQEGWQLHWSHDKDYRLPVNITTSGEIEDVFRKVGSSLLYQGIDINIKLYRSNQVIVIK